MKINVGTIDRIFRILIGIACIALVFTRPFVDSGWERIALGVIGVIMLLTSAVKFCPLYRFFGLRTCKTISKQ